MELLTTELLMQPRPIPVTPYRPQFPGSGGAEWVFAFLIDVITSALILSFLLAVVVKCFRKYDYAVDSFRASFLPMCVAISLLTFFFGDFIFRSLLGSNILTEVLDWTEAHLLISIGLCLVSGILILIIVAAIDRFS